SSKNLIDQKHYLFLSNHLYNKLKQNLGNGEASSIAVALEIKESLLIIDEKKGRRVAAEMKIEIIGSLGVLLKAKEKEVIDSVKDTLDLIDKTDFRISEAVRTKILVQSEEID
ncbi:MAG: DUF3368 domain-containing protein, partial [Bacteroidota bacterium]